MKIALSFEYGEKKMLFPVDFVFILILATFTIDSIGIGLPFPPKNSDWQPKAKCTYIGMNISRNTYVI